MRSNYQKVAVAVVAVCCFFVTAVSDPGNGINRPAAQEKEVVQPQQGGAGEIPPSNALAGGNNLGSTTIQTTYRLDYDGSQQTLSVLGGDVNLNGIPNEVGDAVLFSRYFIYGLQSFTIDRDSQVLESDVNGDGQTLTVGDLVHLIYTIEM